MTEIKKLAITGANGYLGQHTIKRAIQEGWQVNAIVRRKEAAKLVEKLGAKPIIIINFNFNELSIAFKDCQAIIHFANIVCGSKEEFENINVNGIRSILQAASNCGVKRVIYPSGLGTNKFGKVEWANNEYFRSKMLSEKVLQKAKVPYIIFRPSYILGPGDELIPDLINQLYECKVLIAGEGKIPMQPIYIEDATKAFLAAAESKGNDNTIYDLVGPKVINMFQLIQIVHNAIIKLGLNLPPPRIKKIPFEQASKEMGLCQEMIDVMKCDIISNGTIAANALGYKLSPIEKAIEATVKNKLFSYEEHKKKGSVILLSGGIDSATALYWAMREGYDLIGLSINYLNRPEQEKIATANLAKETNIKLIEITAPYVMEAIDLIFKGYPAPCAINAPEGFIPSKNLLFYSIASYFADAYGIEVIIGGHTSYDTRKFPDVSNSFFSKLTELINMGKHNQDKNLIKIKLPLLKMSKAEVVKLAKELRVPIELTWSCYSDGD
ncbi:MAG: 7-cyano-7-deazaguanine synthase, partial [Promethearchaeota archaeon]